MIKTNGRLTYTVDGGKLTLCLTGEIDHHSALVLREEADALIYRLRPHTVAVDLSSIEFMDSSGLGFIMGRYALLRKLGGELIMQDPSPRVSKILALAGMERIIKTERKASLKEGAEKKK